MTKVICLVGASGSGKTTVAKELEKAGYNIIQSYTTRQPREKNEWGHTFLKDYEIYLDAPIDGDNTGWVCEIYDKIRHKTYFKDNMIAYFNNYNSGHHYFATDEQVVRGKANIYIVDPEGAEMVHEFYKGTDIEVITVYLQVDRGVRRKRMIDRCVDITVNECYKVSERLTKDKQLFQTVKCDYVIDGHRDIEEVKKDLIEIIER